VTRSIRASLISGTVVAAVASIAIGGATIYLGARSSLHRQFDEELEEDARMLATAVKATPRGVDLDFEDFDLQDFVPAGDSYLEVWVGDSLLYRSPSLAGHDLDRIDTKADASEFGWARVAGDREVRSVALVFRPAEDPDDPGSEPPGYSSDGGSRDVPMVQLELARPTTGVDVLLGRLRALLAAAGVLAGLVAAAVIAVVVRRSLRPLDHLAGEISRLGDNDLSATIHLPAAPREVAPIVDELNGLLRRLEGAFRRERTFSADIAHELRTPLAGMRSLIEVEVSQPRGATEYRTTLEELLGIVNRLHSVVETLLYLSRLEAGLVEVEEREVDLRELVQSSWRVVEARAAERKLDVRWDLRSSVRVLTDPILLEIILHNVFDNAVSYVDDGGAVSIAVRDAGNRALLRVSNTGSQISGEDVGSLTERFWRGDRSRSTTNQHVGLGLALVSRIAAILRCTLEIDSRAGGDFALTLSVAKPPR